MEHAEVKIIKPNGEEVTYGVRSFSNNEQALLEALAIEKHPVITLKN